MGTARKGFGEPGDRVGAEEIAGETRPADDALMHVQVRGHGAAWEPRGALEREIRRLAEGPLPRPVPLVGETFRLAFPVLVDRGRAVDAEGIREGAGERLRERLPVEFGQEFAQVRHARPDGRHALRLDFDARRGQRGRHRIHVDVEEQRAVEEDPAVVNPFRAPGDLAVPDQDVVASGERGVHAQGFQRVQHRPGVHGEVRVACVGIGFEREDRVVEVAEVVIDRPSPRSSGGPRRRRARARTPRRTRGRRSDCGR